MKKIEPGMLCYVANSWRTVQERGLVVTVVRACALGDEGVTRDGALWDAGCEPSPQGIWLIDCDKPGFPCAADGLHLHPITPPASDKATDTPASRDLVQRMRDVADSLG